MPSGSSPHAPSNPVPGDEGGWLHENGHKALRVFPPILANTTWGRRVERILENFKPWHAILPFQIFKAELSAELV